MPSDRQWDSSWGPTADEMVEGAKREFLVSVPDVVEHTADEMEEEVEVDGEGEGGSA